MPYRTFLLLLCCFWQLSVFAQSPSKAGENLLVNASFEEFSATPIGWFKKGEHYTRVMKFWESPTSASPDIFGSKVRVPNYWSEKGFGVQPPHSGWAMSGITTYGCAGKSTHCREYISVRLNEPLVVGQVYLVEMYVSHLEGSYAAANLGMYFSEERINLQTDELIAAEPQFKVKEILDIKKGKWQRITGQFNAATEAEYLIIGNFDDDESTDFIKHPGDKIPYAYYYIDDVALKKLPPFLPLPLRKDDLTLTDLEEGETFRLKDIYFDFAAWDLHPRSFVELKKLLSLLKKYPDMTIEIIGHTDSIGSYEFNDELSDKRADSVVRWLIENNVTAERLQHRGEGERKPIANNKYEPGRRLNRRVEFRVVKL